MDTLKASPTATIKKPPMILTKTLKKRIWIAVVLFFLTAAVVLFVWMGRMFSVPKSYRPIRQIKSEQVSQYLSNHLIPNLHNKSQRNRPFDYVITQAGLSDVIARHADFDKIAAAGFHDISVAFVPGKILIMGKTKLLGPDMLFTAAIVPAINAKGRLFLKSQAIKIGKSRIPFAEQIVTRKLLENLDSICPQPKLAEVIRTIVSGGAVEPAFEIDGNNIRAEKLTIADKELIVHFVGPGRQ